MRHNVFLLLLAFLLVQAGLSAASNEQVDKLEQANSNQLVFKEAPIPDSIKALLVDRATASNGGNEYYCIFPPNDRSMDIGNMSLYVCSGNSKNTHVWVELAGDIPGRYVLDFELTDPYTSVALCAEPGVKNGIIGVQDEWEVTYDRFADYMEQPITNKGLRVYSDGPDIYVYIGSFREVTAEGYMVLPTNGLGNKYIHCSRNENIEDATLTEPGPGPTTDYRTGFTCIAVQDNTVINMKLRTNLNYCMTYMGNEASEYTTYSSPNLMKNELWNIINRRNGRMNRVCDFTGTILWSDQNFGLVSWVQRTSLPSYSYNSRDNLVEQLLPVSKWGREFVSVQFKGEYEKYSRWAALGTARDRNPGQLFRMVAAEPLTTIGAVWKEIGTREPMGNWEELTADMEGGWIEYPLLIANPDANSDVRGIGGYCHWTSDKPMQLLQYQTSADNVFYRNGYMDPAMVLIPPVEQYGTSTTFKTAPSSNSATFTEHYVTIYVEGPKNPDGSPNTDLAQIKQTLETVEIIEDGLVKTKVATLDPGFTSSRIEETPFYFARLKLKEDMTYHITGKTKLAGSVYGWGSVISYAWPTSMKLVETNTTDVLQPKVSHIINCEIPTTVDENGIIDQGWVTFTCDWADTVNIPKTDVDDGIVDIGLNKQPSIMEDITDNLELVQFNYKTPYFPPSNIWSNEGKIKEGSVTFKTTDPYKDVRAVIGFQDGAGNETYDSLVYISDKIAFLDVNGQPLNSISFGTATVGTTAYQTVILKNTNDAPESIAAALNSIYLMNENFTISTNTTKIELEPGDTTMLVIAYSPASTASMNDYLCIQTNCLFFSIPVNGGAGFASISVSDWNFGSVKVNTPTPPAHYIRVTNSGELTLTLEGYTFNPAQDPTNGPFIHLVVPGQGNIPATFPYNIAAGQYADFTVQFKPIARGEVEADLCFTSNAAGIDIDPNFDNCGLVEGNGIETGPIITMYDFERRRVGTSNIDSVQLTNTGNVEIEIREIPVPAGWTKSGTRMTNSDGSYFVEVPASLQGRKIYPINDASRPTEDKEVWIVVGFEPKSEHLPYGSCPDREEFVVNFSSASSVPDNTCRSSIAGEAFLPKIKTIGYTFPDPLEINNAVSQTAAISIADTSFTEKLTIRRITKLPVLQHTEFVISANGVELDWTSDGYLLSMPNNNDTTFDVTFAPLSTSPVDRVCLLEIESDGYPAPDSIRLDTIEIRGRAYDLGIFVGDIDYGEITRCDSPLESLNITNLSTTNTMTVTDVKIGDPRYATLLTIENLSVPFQIPVSNQPNISVKLRFNACEYTDANGEPTSGTVKIPVIVTSDMGIDTAEITATPLYIPVRVTLPQIEALPGRRPEFPISISIANTGNAFNTFDNAKITSFEIVLNVSRARLFFDNAYIAISGWDFTISHTADDKVTIKGWSTDGTTYLSDGSMVIPTPLVMVSPEISTPITIESVTFVDRDCCVRYETENGTVQFEICAQTARGDIQTSSENYSIAPVSPNPYQDKVLNVNYSIGLDAHTTVEIFDSFGRLVKSVTNEHQAVGKYSRNVNIGDLASGAYTIIIKSGPYEDSQPLVIVR